MFFFLQFKTKKQQNSKYIFFLYNDDLTMTDHMSVHIIFTHVYNTLSVLLEVQTNYLISF